MRNRRRPLLATLTCFAVVLASFSGCLFSKPTIFGTWVLVNDKGEKSSITVTFNEDGTYQFGYDSSYKEEKDLVDKAVDTFIGSGKR